MLTPLPAARTFMISRNSSYTSFLSENLFLTSRRYVSASLVVRRPAAAAAAGPLRRQEQAQARAHGVSRGRPTSSSRRRRLGARPAACADGRHGLPLVELLGRAGRLERPPAAAALAAALSRLLSDYHTRHVRHGAVHPFVAPLQ